MSLLRDTTAELDSETRARVIHLLVSLVACNDEELAGDLDLAHWLEWTIDSQSSDVGEDLLTALPSADPGVAWAYALHLLERRPGSAAAERAQEQLRSLPADRYPHPVDRLEFDRDTDRLKRIARTHPGPAVRARALERLLHLGVPARIWAIRHGLTDSDPQVRETVTRGGAEAIRGFHVSLVADLLRAAADPGVRAWIVRQLPPRKCGELTDWVEKSVEATPDAGRRADLIRSLRFGTHVDADDETGRLLRDRIAELLVKMAERSGWGTALPAIEILAEMGHPGWREPARERARDDEEVPPDLLAILRRHGRASELDLVLPALRSSSSRVQAEALRAIAALAPDRPTWHRPAARMLRSPDEDLQIAALDALRARGDARDLPRVEQALRADDPDVRRRALRVAVHLAPDRAVELALPLLTDREELPARCALEILESRLPTDELRGWIRRTLRKAPGASGALLLGWLKRHAPEELDAWLALAPRLESVEARWRAARLLIWKGAESVPVLRRLWHDRAPVVRFSALTGLCWLLPDEARDLKLDALRDKDWVVRQAAVEMLSRDPSPDLVNPLLAMARDADEDVRKCALGALARHDDIRVLGELTSSLNDVDGSVRETAQEILAGRRGPVAILDRLGRKEAERIWTGLAARVAEINRWAIDTAQELLGKPVVVYNYRSGLGRTWTRKTGTIPIELSDTPVTTGHPHGEEIMRGLALHEIGHHLHDFGQPGHATTRGIARAEGIREIYDILLDERLERRLRSRRPEWGVYFDRLASYAFSQNRYEIPLTAYATLVGREPEELAAAIEKGEFPGSVLQRPDLRGRTGVRLREAEVLRIPGLAPPLTAFLSCLRGRVDPRSAPDPTIARALAEVPPNLKELTHAEVLEAARRIAAHLGRIEQSRRQAKALLSRLRRQRRLLRAWQEALRKLAESGMVPAGAQWGLPGIPATVPIRAPAPQPVRRGQARPGAGGWGLHLGPELGFAPLDREVTLSVDEAAQSRMIAPIRRHIRRLREYLERLGREQVDEPASRRGRRLDLAGARRSAAVRRPDLLVHSREELRPDAYVGILIDRSGSMAGSRLERAQSFGLLLAESARGIRGLEGHVSAFDGYTFYRLGSFRRNAIASLTADDGNNDAGGLQKAAELALRSRRRTKIVIMISDGSPTECTVESLRLLVERLERERGVSCLQAAVAPIPESAFPRCVDLSEGSLDEAVGRFGRLLTQLTGAAR